MAPCGYRLGVRPYAIYALFCTLFVLSAWHLKQIWYSAVAGFCGPLASYPLTPSRLAWIAGGIAVPIWAEAVCELLDDDAPN